MPEMLKLSLAANTRSTGPQQQNADDHNCPVDTAERSSSADWRTADADDRRRRLFVSNCSLGKVNNDIFIFHGRIFYFRQLFCACYIIRIGLVSYWINPFSVGLLLCWKNSSPCQQLICYIAQSWLILNVHICILLYESMKISLNFSYQSSEEHAIALMEDFSQRQNNVDDWTE